MEPSAHTLSSFFDRIRVQIKSFFTEYPSWVFDTLFFASIGLLVGFFVRLCGKLLLVIILCTVAALYALQWYDLIVIKADMPMLFGHQVTDAQALIEGVQHTISHNPIAAISALLGFTLGWRLGR